MTSDAHSAETPSRDAKADRPEVDGASAKRTWLSRPSIRTIRRRTPFQQGLWATSDQRDNEATRLPADEAVHLGAVTLVESFTPSTVHSLYDALENLPVREPDKKRQWRDALRASRGTPDGGGWQNLAVIRPPGAFILSNGFHDATLPVGVDAVWLHLHYPTASLALVVATFALKEDAGDLSTLLRSDFQTRTDNVRVHVSGRLGSVRSRLPWARPKSYRSGAAIQNVVAQKSQAYQDFAANFEDACWRWFTSRFPGRFAMEPLGTRPSARILFTRKNIPFKDRLQFMDPIGIGGHGIVWRSTDPKGWALKFDGQQVSERRRPAMLVAARRSDAASEHETTEKDSLWVLTQAFDEQHGTLIVRWAMTTLISLYIDRLGELRDRAGRRKRFRRPVRQARDLDRFLLGDGLDASTVASDIRLICGNPDRFRWHVPKYSEDREEYPTGVRESREPLEMIPALRDSLDRKAQQLLQDMDTTTRNVGASAQLRQAIANTRLQRLVLMLSIAATIIALVSLIVSSGGS